MAYVMWASKIWYGQSADAKPNATTYAGHIVVEEDLGHIWVAKGGAWLRTDAISDDSTVAGHAATHTHVSHTGIGATDHHSNANDHTRLHTVTQTLDHTFPGGTTTFLRADGTFAAAGGAGTWTTVIKTADESRTNNTLLDDATLVFTTVANTQYIIRLVVHMLTNATADSKYRMAHAGTTTRVRRRIVRTATNDTPAEVASLAAFDAADVVLSTTGTLPFVEEHIVLQVGASGGVLSFQWAQNTTNAGAMTVLEGSYLEYATS